MKKMTCEQCATRELTCIADLPAEQLDEFRDCGVSAIYKRRQIVFHEGTPASGLYIVCHGAVKLYHSDRFGRDHILGVAGAGDVLGEMPLDPGEPYSVSAEALTESQICYLPRERLVQFIQTHPMTGVRLIAALSKALGSARKKVRGLALKQAENRLAELLMQLAGAAGGASANGRTRVRLDYTRREIAEMIGVSTETAIRLLSRLRRKRIISTAHRELIINDAERLARIANHEAIA